jgi:hypothetical protein
MMGEEIRKATGTFLLYIALHSDEQDAVGFNRSSAIVQEHLASRTSGVSECVWVSQQAEFNT